MYNGENDIVNLLDLIDGKKQRRSFKKDRRRLVYLRDGKRCRYCNKKLKYNQMEVDHVKPVASHGNDYVFNLACSCRTCNRSKSAKTWVKPRKLPVWRQVFGIILILYYLDLPTIEDFV